MYRQLGALSGLAMILIVLNHSIELALGYYTVDNAYYLEEWVRSLLLLLQTFGIFAVPIFLFISGSFVTYAASGEKRNIPRKFVLSSLRRILWPYLIWSIAFYILIFIHRGDQYTIPAYLKFLLVGYPFHFIPLLVVNYLLAPLLIWVGRRFPVILILAVALYQLLLLNALDPRMLGFEFPGWANYLLPPVIRSTFADWGIFFPLGLVIGLHTHQVVPVLKKFWWVFTIATFIFFAFTLISVFTGTKIPLARVLAPVTFVCLIPLISRNSIPFVYQLEKIGKRSYGIYLIHLIVIDLSLFLLQKYLPWLFLIPMILFPLLFILGLAVPLWMMGIVARSSSKKVYPYIFG